MVSCPSGSFSSSRTMACPASGWYHEIGKNRLSPTASAWTPARSLASAARGSTLRCTHVRGSVVLVCACMCVCTCMRGRGEVGDESWTDGPCMRGGGQHR